jgi:biopolymer transport protein ExbD
MTPMIDVVFLLIVFFLCIDFRVLEAKLPAYLPKDTGVHVHQLEPQEQVVVRIVCDDAGEKIRRPGVASGAYFLEGHAIHWEVGPERIRRLDDLVDKLTGIACDPSRRRPDPRVPGHTKLASVVVEPLSQTTYGDVATTVDAVIAAGFADIAFGGGYGTRQAR